MDWRDKWRRFRNRISGHLDETDEDDGDPRDRDDYWEHFPGVVEVAWEDFGLSPPAEGQLVPTLSNLSSMSGDVWDFDEEERDLEKELAPIQNKDSALEYYMCDDCDYRCYDRDPERCPECGGTHFMFVRERPRRG